MEFIRNKTLCLQVGLDSDVAHNIIPVICDKGQVAENLKPSKHSV